MPRSRTFSSSSQISGAPTHLAPWATHGQRRILTPSPLKPLRSAKSLLPVPCGPSRASMLTGLCLHNHRTTMNIALAMVDAGYHPALFGYTDTPLDPDLSNVGRMGLPGFTAIVFASRRPRQRLRSSGRPSAHLGPGRQDYEEHTVTALGHFGGRYGYSERLLVYLDAMCPWTSRQTASAALRAAAGIGTPQRFRCRSRPRSGYRETTPVARIRYEAQESRRSHRINPPLPNSTNGTPAASASPTMASGRRSIRADNHRLKSLGVYDETLVIFCSHGKLGDNGSTTAIFTIIRDPRPAADPARGSRVNAFTEHDLAPTISEALGSVPDFETDGHPWCHFSKAPNRRNGGVTPRILHTTSGLPRRSVETALSLQSDECHFRAIPANAVPFHAAAGRLKMTQPKASTLPSDHHRTFTDRV